MTSTLFFGALCGIICGLVARYFNVPGGAFIGSMFGCAVYSGFVQGGVVVPSNLRLVVQIAAGIMIGATVRPEIFEAGWVLFAWAAGSAILFLSVGMLLAYIAFRLGHLDKATAFFSFAPGGLTGMAVVSQEEGAIAGQVVLMHFARVFLIFSTVPFLVRWLLSR